MTLFSAFGSVSSWYARICLIRESFIGFPQKGFQCFESSCLFLKSPCLIPTIFFFFRFFDLFFFHPSSSIGWSNLSDVMVTFNNSLSTWFKVSNDDLRLYQVRTSSPLAFSLCFLDEDIERKIMNSIASIHERGSPFFYYRARKKVNSVM